MCYRAGLIVNFTIDFYDKPMRQAAKVGDVRPDRMLATKLGFGAAPAKALP